MYVVMSISQKGGIHLRKEAFNILQRSHSHDVESSVYCMSPSALEGNHYPYSCLLIFVENSSESVNKD